MQTRIKRHRIGEVSSKYGYNLEQFDKDMEDRNVPPNADGKQKRHCAIKLNANERLDNLLSIICRVQ